VFIDIIRLREGLLVAVVVALIPAYNEEGSIGATIEALLAQTRVPDRIVVIPNGCTDKTAEIARSYQEQSDALIVFELSKLEHKKSEALNRAWNAYGRDADVILSIDGDTCLPDNAVADWEKELASDSKLGGSSSKATMLGPNFWTRMQRSEFAMWNDHALRRGWTTVLVGTGCAINGKALRSIVDETSREGPWSYDSQVEDFELTCQIRKRGYYCHVSPTVRAYTDSMKSFSTLWNQRMKWQVGTIEDLLKMGLNRLTLLDWWQQCVALSMTLVRLLWFTLIVLQIALGLFQFNAIWWVVVPVLFSIGGGIMTNRIPFRDKWDILIGYTVIISEFFSMIRSAWFVAAWIEVLWGKLTGSRKDRWEIQYSAEDRAAAVSA